MECDMCGRKIESYFLGKVEGVNMRLCERCSSHSKIIRKPVQEETINKNIPRLHNNPINTQNEEEVEESVVKDFAKIIRREREKRKMEQEEFAKLISEKVSILQRIEKGDYVPSINVVKRIARTLNIGLIEEVKTEGYIPLSSSKSYGLTLGDLIKIKKK